MGHKLGSVEVGAVDFAVSDSSDTCSFHLVQYDEMLAIFLLLIQTPERGPFQKIK